MPDHVLGDYDREVVLAIVNLEAQPDKVGQDGRGAGLRAHGGDLVALFLGPHDGKSAQARKTEVRRTGAFDCLGARGTASYGTRCGPGKTSESVVGKLKVGGPLVSYLSTRSALRGRVLAASSSAHCQPRKFRAAVAGAGK